MKQQQQQEHQILETYGRFTVAVKANQELSELSWSKGRICLSNRRLVLITNDGKKTISLADLTGISGGEGSIGALSEYLKLQISGDTVVVSAEDHSKFKTSLYSTLLESAVLRVKYPAVAGGVIKDTSWKQARLSVALDSLTASLQNGKRIEFQLADITSVQLEDRAVDGESTQVVAVSHTADGGAVETHLTGSPRLRLFSKAFLKHGEREGAIDVELNPAEEEILMGLYSGVSPFKIPEFVGMDIDKVEAVYDRLIELGILDRVRTRSEVTVTASGRAITSDAASE
jgi:helix-turn-helix protein